MGDIAFDEFSLPLWLRVRVRKRGSAEMPFSCFLCACLGRNVSMVTSVWTRYFPFGLLRFGFRGPFSGEIRSSSVAACVVGPK